MVLYNDSEVTFEKFEDNSYRITFFNSDNRWHGELAFTKNEVIFNDLNSDYEYKTSYSF